MLYLCVNYGRISLDIYDYVEVVVYVSGCVSYTHNRADDYVFTNDIFLLADHSNYGYELIAYCDILLVFLTDAVATIKGQCKKHRPFVVMKFSLFSQEKP